MRNDYIKRFFALTEQNIIENQSSANEPYTSENKETNTKNNRFTITVVALLLLGLSVFLLCLPTRFNQANMSTSPPMPNQSAPQKTASLNSVIPGFRVAASHRFLQPISLHKADIALSNDISNEHVISSAPLMDKVLVTPKSFG